MQESNEASDQRKTPRKPAGWAQALIYNRVLADNANMLIGLIDAHEKVLDWDKSALLVMQSCMGLWWLPAGSGHLPRKASIWSSQSPQFQQHAQAFAAHSSLISLIAG